MKKIISVLFAFVISFTVFAQNNSEHLKFMGIPINGTCYQLAQKIAAKGFQLKPIEGKAATPSSTHIKLMGTFAGIDNCEIYVIGTKGTKTAWKVVVYLPEEDKWSDIKYQYNKFKESLEKKYGEPDDDFHFFSSPYYEGDGYEMSAIELEECHYSAFWDNGIYIMISKFCQVKICYEDPINSEKDEKYREIIMDKDL